MSRPLEPSWFTAWANWFRSGHVRSRRPKEAPKRIPQWAWDLYSERYPHHKTGPPPKAPPPPKPKPSWTLTNGPWIFVESDPGSCRPGPWTRLDIKENEIADGAPLWYCPNGDVPQMEGGTQGAACLEYCKGVVGHGSVAPVTTLGIDPAPFLAIGVTSVMVETYLQSSEIALRKLWGAGNEGWPDPIAVVGVYGGVTLEEYVAPRRFAANGEEIGWPGLAALGTRFGVYASDAMSEADWAVLEDLVAGH